MESGITMDYEQLKVGELYVEKPYPTMQINTDNGDWYIKINKDKIEFNEKYKLTSDEFAKEFIRILENDGFGLGVKGKIRELIKECKIKNESLLDSCAYESSYQIEEIIEDLEELLN